MVPTSRLGAIRSRLDSPLLRLEHFFVPDESLADGNVDDRAAQMRYRRMAGVIAGASVAAFVPSMVVAGVPTRLWPPFVAGVIAAAVLISWSLLAVRPRTRWALVSAVVTAAAVFGLDRLIGDYYHQAALLFALLVVGYAVIHGPRAAMVIVTCGGLVVPLASTGERGFSPTDPIFAFLYLAGIAAIVWTYSRLQDRGATALRASEARYRELVEEVPAVVYTSDFGPDGAWTYVSPRIEGLLGFPTEAWTSDPGFWWSRVHPDDRDRVLAYEAEGWAYPTGTRSAIEYRMIGCDGRVRWVNDDAVVVVPEDDSPPHWRGLLTDVSERRELEAKLREAQRLEGIGRLAGGIAHDFNNMLTVINGTAELLADAMPPDDVRRADVEAIRETGGRAADLTRQLLAFGRRQRLRPSEVDLGVVLGELAPILRRTLGEDVELVLRAGPDAGAVHVDRAQLEQVIVNLVFNGRDAMPQGGVLTIQTAPVEVSAELAATHPGASPGRFARLEVRDSGTGIEPDTLEHIFEPFFTTKVFGSGTGLGLATVEGIVAQSGGWIEVASQSGRGSTFAVHLPCATKPGTPDEAAPACGQVPGGTETILLVEDEPTVRIVTASMLRDLGYTVVEAPGPDEALALPSARLVGIDLLVSDVVMPSMPGPRLASELARRHPLLRMMLVSGFAPGTVLEGGLLEPGTTFLAKPYSRNELAAAVRRALAASPDPGGDPG